ncbi:ABC transporter ATP-binding protein [Halarcobacter ebronensis]|uniref:ABC transporter ATP-binding protein n=1 Tax=Halarcobacter ebronensis TaxID=1462615 RepID=A0A4Q0YFK5_9BACT|nr:ATP-binding cassette domain-containing protein [Halarcobacter ebronensis]QKF81033.1 ABC transporter, ATP-binding protein [Halarcobacter ebronensis]RXJ68935.1 ABC transporter ATP-binding protein [Halarcobacter ebronensis]RXK06343.1 ABC transporter ATP-binding protein [Halarcobacter ebronensis]
MNENLKIIDFENIYVSYEITPVLENINLTINQGEHWAILGQNGSGKSTLIKLISNDLYPNTKYKFRKNLFGKERWSIFELKKNLGIITNDLHNYFEKHGNFLTAYEVVLSGYYSSIGIFKHQDFTNEQHERALEVLEFLEILEIKDKRVHQMSTGQLRRCVIGRALIHKPKAFILDEPTTGLDIKAQVSFLNIIRKLSKNSSIIIVTHHFEEIFPEIDNIALMYNKTIYKKGKKADILTSENISKIFDSKITLANENNRYYVKSIN